jgi:hypothetical protein
MTLRFAVSAPRIAAILNMTTLPILRRLCLGLIGSCALLLCGSIRAADLEREFQQPPLSARPRTLWMWMNGNVTPDGITRDLEAMKRVGLGGALIFNVGEFIPKGPVDYGSDVWLERMKHAAAECDRLGLELAMHNCPGWSSSGGPWITPEMSMQRLVWSETKVGGGKDISLALPRPFSRLNYYRDICVLAFPSLPGEERPFTNALQRLHHADGSIPIPVLSDGDLTTCVPASSNNPVVLEFAEPFIARAVTIQYTSGGGTIGFTLEASDDGVNFRTVTRLRPATPRAIEDASLVETFEPVRAKFFRVYPARPRGLCEVELHASPRIPAWNFKGNHSYRPAQQESAVPEVPREYVIPIEQVMDLSERMDADGRLQWKAPPGNWTIVRFGHTSRGQENIAAPDAGVGLECDKMSRQATAFHFEKGLGPLLRALGPLAGRAFTGLEIDSYEVGVQNWTAGFEREFRKRNGYGIHRYLPAMTGRYVGSADISERFLWDLRRTHAELVVDYYYGELRELCRAKGLRLFAEPYGAGPGAYDELQVAGRVDVPMGEFWAHFPWDDMMSIRLAASAAHVRGRSLVAGEAFTATEEQSRFLDHPFGLKTTGDLAFSLGLNQMYFHRNAHQPHPTAVPGMTMGPWGFNFDRNNPWFEKSSGWLSYLARSQYLLQQGTFVADVLYCTGEGSPQPSKRLVPDLPGHFQFDAIDEEGLLRDASVREGRIVLRGGGSYRLLAFPPDVTAMTPGLLRKLRSLVADGAVVLAPRPAVSPTLRDFPDADTTFRAVRDELWPAGGGNVTTIGKGRCYSNQRITEVLSQLNVIADFEYTGVRPDASLVWLHRRVNDAEVYFIANRQRRVEEVVCSFRVVGRQPEIWRPDSGGIHRAPVFDFARNRTHLPLRLEPAESIFVVFRSSAAAAPVKSVARNHELLITSSLDRSSAASSVTNNFTLTAWIRPDTDMTAMPQELGKVEENGKGWIVAAPEGDTIHGAGHAALGIAAGRNGVIVAERTAERLTATLVSRTPVSGWTHLAIVCRDGKPSLYLNGRLDRNGQASGAIVHPGLNAPPGRKPIYYFDGDMTDPQLTPECFPPERIAMLAQGAMPDPDLPAPMELVQGGAQAIVWEAGTYQLNDGRELRITNVPAPMQFTNAWNVSLPRESTAAREISLPRLTGLQRHEDGEVRHFAGTAQYRTELNLPASAWGEGQRLWLDLGRVAVIAEVTVNGQELGQVWKPPYRLEITKAARPGLNRIEVRVTTLLVNRLIGDESLPEENEYDPRTRAIRRLPEWYVEGRPKPAGGRATFSTWKYFSAQDPLVEAGLLGPVRILTSVNGTFRDGVR